MRKCSVKYISRVFISQKTHIVQSLGGSQALVTVTWHDVAP